MNVAKVKQAPGGSIVVERAAALGDAVLRRVNLLRSQAPDNAARPPLGLFLA